MMMKGVLGKRACLLDLQEFLFFFHFALINVGIDAFFDEGQRVSFGDFEENFVNVLRSGFFIEFD